MAALVSDFLDDDPIHGFAGVVDTAAGESPDNDAIEPGGPEDVAGTCLADSRFDLGRPGRRWNVRVHRYRLGHGAFTPEVVQRTLITLQFWP